MSARSSMLDRYPRRDGVYYLFADAVAVHDRYQGRMVKLDSLGSEIWLRIDGLTLLADIALDIAGQNGQPVNEVMRNVAAMTGILIGEGLVHLDLEPKEQPYHLATPYEDQDPAQAEESMRASGWGRF